MPLSIGLGLASLVQLSGSGGAPAWTPAQLPAAALLGGWWDLSDTATLWEDDAGTVSASAATDPVRRADTVYGSAPALVAPSDAARPVIVSDVDGLRLRSDGVDDLMSSTAAVSGTPTHYWFAGVVYAETTANGRAMSFGDFEHALRHNGGNWVWGVNSADGIASVGAPNQKSVIIGTVDFSAGSPYPVMATYNGVIKTGNTTKTAVNGSLVLFAQDASGDTSCACDWWEIGCGEGPLTTDARQRVEGYLAHKHNIASNLPVDHPYRDMAP